MYFQMYSSAFFLLLMVSVQQCRALNKSLIISFRSNQSNTQYIGKIENFEFSYKNYSIAQFLGIPFANVPLGDLRFSLPQPYNMSSWHKYHALKFKDICVQRKDPANECQKNRKMSEDCLYLNVYVPIKTSASETVLVRNLSDEVISRYPVYIFIHGGAFFRGNGNCYDPSKLAAYGEIIVVTINYRLGALGFASTGDGVIPGNMGLWDQLEAIKWVKRYIDGFSGDPDQITVGGQSAGSYSTLFQALSPSSAGLFRRVIAESGTPAARNSVSKVGRQTTVEFAKAMGCEPVSLQSSSTIKDCLQMKRSEDIAEKVMPSLVPSSLPFQPTLEDSMVDTKMDDYMSSLASGQDVSAPSSFADKDLLIGYVAQDGEVFYRLWTVLLNDSVKSENARADQVHRTINTDTFKWIIFQTVAKSINDKVEDYNHLIEAVLERYIDWDNRDNPNKTSNRAMQMLTDIFFAVPVLQTALSHASGRSGKSSAQRKGSTYLYKFQLPITNAKFKEEGLSWFEGTEHSAEVPYVFGWKDDAAGVELSKTVMTYWANFIKYGNPNGKENMTQSDMDSVNQSLTNKSWAEFSGERQSYLLLSSPAESREHLYVGVSHFWNVYLPSLAKRFQEQYEAGLMTRSDKCRNSGDTLHCSYFVIFVVISFIKTFLFYNI